MKAIEIDGSFGEGGGQILRTALSLSCITGSKLRLFNIRKGREKPGLRPQHITCINAAAIITHARVSGNRAGSTDIIFTPVKVRPGNYLFDIKTAGSCSLVFQTLVPLIFAGEPSHITIRGGTHVPFSPSYHYISQIFLPALKKIGIHIESTISSCGFYPKGGGQADFSIFPSENITSMNLTERGDFNSLSLISGVSGLPLSIAERQKQSAMNLLASFPADAEILEAPSPGQGTFVFIKAEYENSSAGFSSLGKKGKPAEEVGKEAAEEFIDFNRTHACIDPYLADQIVIYLSLAGQNSSFTTSRITQHLLTNLWVIEKFLNIEYEIEGEPGREGRVKIITNIDF